jgi:outer membrane protein assembly factor BamB
MKLERSSTQFSCLCLLILLSFSPHFTQTTSARTLGLTAGAAARQGESSILLRWPGKPGVERYRLQLATDARFRDIVFDQAVVGRQHLLKGLAPGRYFWRIAPSLIETGAFSLPTLVEVTTSSVAVASNFKMPDEVSGWHTATGEVLSLTAAHLRSKTIADILCLKKDGTLSALDGATGVALWTARNSPAGEVAVGGSREPAQFSPLMFQGRGQSMGVVMSFAAGVLALRADSGTELWRAGLEGRPEVAVAGDLNADGLPEVVIVMSEPHKIYVLDSLSGRVLADKNLDADVIGEPVILPEGYPAGVALALKNGSVEIRKPDGNLGRSVKLTSELMTGPIAVKRAGIASLLIGTREGLMAAPFNELELMRLIAPSDDPAREKLAAIDLDGDGEFEIIMLTKRGGVAVVEAFDGRVKWRAEGANAAASAVFADVNTDGVLDVIVPGGAAFASGYSGRDGSLIWKVEGAGGKSYSKGASESRALVIAPTLNGGGFIIGSDPEGIGLRAVELPKGALKRRRNERIL